MVFSPVECLCSGGSCTYSTHSIDRQETVMFTDLSCFLASLGQNSGSCRSANFTSCCQTGSGCQGFNGSCYCDLLCYSIGDCCSDIAEAGCVNGSSTQSSCIAANFTQGCCTSGTCHGVGDTVCYCDQACHVFNDCCNDVNETGCLAPVTTPSPPGSCKGDHYVDVVLSNPYLEL